MKEWEKTAKRKRKKGRVRKKELEIIIAKKLRKKELERKTKKK